MRDVLFLVHRLPFPPDKGDKIRSYYLLRHLVSNYNVHLGCFIDDADDEQYIPELAAMCASLRVLRLDPLLGRLRSAKGLLTGQALSVPYYFDIGLAKWVRQTLESHDVFSVIAFSSPMAQYAMGDGFGPVRRIMDFVDVDSDKWAQYAAKKRWPMNWVYSRESSRLLEYELSIARKFDASIFVTDDEVGLFSSLAPEEAAKIHAVPNGVSTEYFNPSVELTDPYPAGVKPVVFTGMMDYWANVDAVTWFVNEVFPAIRANHRDSEFWIVGGSPTSDVRHLEKFEGVRVTGRVPDVRPYLKYSACAVAPLRIARGIQNKVLEALAMDCPVVCTTQAAAGIGDSGAPPPLSVEDEALGFARKTSEILRDEQRGVSNGAGRKYAVEHYGWEHAFERFEAAHLGTAA